MRTFRVHHDSDHPSTKAYSLPIVPTVIVLKSDGTCVNKLLTPVPSDFHSVLVRTWPFRHYNNKLILIIAILHGLVVFQCSRTCGSGYRHRQVTCRDVTTDVIMPDAVCFQQNSSRPNETIACSSKTCYIEIRWVMSSWSSVSDFIYSWNWEKNRHKWYL